MPPDHVEVNDTDCPLSIVGFAGTIVGVVIAELTVTVSPAEQAVVGVVVPVSVTW